MTLSTPAGPVQLADSIRDLSAHRYLLFNQAWARENGLGADLYAVDSHLTRLGLFLNAGNTAAAGTEYNNLLLGLHQLTAGPEAVPLQAAVLAPLCVSLNGQPCTDTSEAGLAATATALLHGLTQAQLTEAVAAAKKNFRPN